VAKALAHGADAFRSAVADRILREHPEAIARCTQCSRVLRTPRSRQCRWCGHDWH
jgi:hypothetical protein